MRFWVTPITVFGAIIVTQICLAKNIKQIEKSSYSLIEEQDNENSTLITVPDAFDVEVSESSSLEITTETIPDTTILIDTFSTTTFEQNDTFKNSWVQKIKQRRLFQSREQFTSRGTGNSPLWFGQIVSKFLYGEWSLVDINANCAKDLITYKAHIRESKIWAIKMLDSSAKGPDGLLTGNTASFGNFEQCLSATSKSTGISGGYTLVDIDFRPFKNIYPKFYDNDHSKDYDVFIDNDESIWEVIKHRVQPDYIQRHHYQWAICLPNTCKPNDVQNIVTNTLIPQLKHYGMEGNVSVDPTLHTSKLTLREYTVGFYLTCVFFLILVSMVFLGTWYDFLFLYYKPKSEHGSLKKIMKPFSLISNLDRLMKPSQSDEFSIMNGFKFLCILQVIHGHRNIREFGNPQMNNDFNYWMLHNFFTSVFKCVNFLETFFVISGFLTYNLLMKQLASKKRLDFIPIMIYRWLRIFPVYGALLLTYIFLLPYSNNGPYWQNIVYKESDRCKNNWWTNLLFINNYVNTENSCTINAWYLACDMHFFIIGVLLTYAIWKWKTLGIWVLYTCLGMSTILPGYLIYTHKYIAVAPLDATSLKDLASTSYYRDIYIKSHMRAMPYFIGMVAAYIYEKLKESRYKFPLKTRIFWLSTCFIAGFMVYLSPSLFFVFDFSRPYSSFEHAMFFTIPRLVLSLAISYAIIVHGISNTGVFLSGFLGHRSFQVLAKLVFCIYVFQEIIQIQTVASMKTPIYQDFTTLGFKFGGDLFMAIIYAFIVNVTIESPCDRLQKNVMKLFNGELFIKNKTESSSIQKVVTLREMRS
ncbi:nose resistant to fluoxetine protein 6-like [Daktulosphaira vitifoliae]|uniref:nose resistant to fluoxetine protein 6-like n=1 Tax=Daktulosphaira vitifoliae TaxID=58002 RepID=UPI0021A9A9D3|nr:nose resistant to fluoxetine protein 6-like [Daktulosphaira vitifoliae]